MKSSQAEVDAVSEEASPPAKRSQSEVDDVSEEASPPAKRFKTIEAEEEVSSTGNVILSEDEERKLQPEHWISVPSAERGNEVIRRCMPVIRKAYLTIKINSGITLLTDLLDYLRDMNTIFHFTHCVLRMKDFLKEIQAARMILSNEDDDPHQVVSSATPEVTCDSEKQSEDPHQVVSSATPEETCDSEKQSEGESSQNFHRIFLVAKHILEQFDVHPTGDHRLSTPAYVEAGVKHMKTELRAAESELMDAIKKCFSLDPFRCYHVLEKMDGLTRRFKTDMAFSSAYVRGRDVFEKVGRLLYLDYSIDGEEEDGFQKNFFAVLNEMRDNEMINQYRRVTGRI